MIENNARCFQCMYHVMYRPNLPGFPRKVKCQKHSNPTNKWYINSDSFPSGLVNDTVPVSMVLLSFWRMSAGDRAAVWGVNGRIRTCRAQSKLEVLILPNIAAFGPFGPLPWWRNCKNAIQQAGAAHRAGWSPHTRHLWASRGGWSVWGSENSGDREWIERGLGMDFGAAEFFGSNRPIECPTRSAAVRKKAGQSS